MIKIILLFSTFFCFIEANYKIIENENIFIIKTDNRDFQEILLKLKDEINFEGFTIVYELNLAKSTNEVAALLEKKGVLKEGINLGICKSSFTFQMVEENPNNINYCPLGLSVYKNSKNENFISYKKYKAFKSGDKIADKINERLKNLIIKSLD
ncbi:hypothetical protein AVENP_0529 [Arcobacter venerupis]|uniref:DUF302 domain-containing protein n=1 Tax=Arcobacter venerupis TaxID=1054033 RepID=A0AAE7B6A0_9BACT|nr:hypothetical protein [Arcobacter venerupis]QKF66103.1 hypothetical protein AVENP_0529 [Arcobacter venerupis]RWS51108.1 hypothetical protein CKA56_01900 [Arcobacter venerupis]